MHLNAASMVKVLKFREASGNGSAHAVSKPQLKKLTEGAITELVGSLCRCIMTKVLKYLVEDHSELQTDCVQCPTDMLFVNICLNVGLFA